MWTKYEIIGHLTKCAKELYGLPGILQGCFSLLELYAQNILQRNIHEQ
jgi:hypothetical protein